MHGSLDTRTSAARTDILFHCHSKPNFLHLTQAAFSQIRAPHFRLLSLHVVIAKALRIFAETAPAQTVQKLSSIH
jgi:hypothetical protein